MGTGASTGQAEVTVLPEGLLEGEATRQFSAASVAELTHLPTGIGSGRSVALTLPPGATPLERAGEADALLVHVLAGQAVLLWGDDPPRATGVITGQTALVPAGTAFHARNASRADELMLVILRAG